MLSYCRRRDRPLPVRENPPVALPVRETPVIPVTPDCDDIALSTLAMPWSRVDLASEGMALGLCEPERPGLLEQSERTVTNVL